MIPVSVLIIAQNEGHRIGACLKSLSRFQEIIVVDGGSTDNTKEVCEKFANVKHTVNHWPGFIAQRNKTIELATQKWCFMIDADETCTPELADHIEKTIKDENSEIKLWRIVRTEYFEGVEITHGHGRSNYQERLFLREQTQYTGGNHHRHAIDGRLIEEGDYEMADFPFHIRVLHDQTYGLDQWLKKIPRFTYLMAHEKIGKGKKIGPFMILLNFFGTFIQTYFKSYKMGRMGLNIALLTAYNRSLVKLYIFNVQTFRQGNKERNEFEQNYLG